MNVGIGSFTPLVFSVYHSVGCECKTFYARLAELISEKRSLTSYWVRIKISFALLISSFMCILCWRCFCRKLDLCIDIAIDENTLNIPIALQTIKTL